MGRGGRENNGEEERRRGGEEHRRKPLVCFGSPGVSRIELELWTSISIDVQHKVRKWKVNIYVGQEAETSCIYVCT